MLLKAEASPLFDYNKIIRPNNKITKPSECSARALLQAPSRRFPNAKVYTAPRQDPTYHHFKTWIYYKLEIFIRTS